MYPAQSEGTRRRRWSLPELVRTVLESDMPVSENDMVASVDLLVGHANGVRTIKKMKKIVDVMLACETERIG